MTGMISFWSTLLSGAALALYGLGVVLSLGALVARRREWVSAIPWLALSGFVIQLGAIIARGVEGGGVPMRSPRDVVFLLAWAAMSVYLLAHFRLRLEVMGVVILPLVVALMLMTLLIPAGQAEIPDRFRSLARAVHIIPAVLGVGALFLTFAASLLYLIQERALKAHRPVTFFLRLPSLERCERLGHVSLSLGFLLLTFVIATGAAAATLGAPGDWQWVLREKWALAAWLLFAAVMYDRVFSGGWRGRKAAYLSILGFCAVILRMLGA